MLLMRTALLSLVGYYERSAHVVHHDRRRLHDTMMDLGLCGDCAYALLKPTRRGTVYLRCGRAVVDDRLSRYPRLPVLECVGYEPATEGER
jgi:hypothetical protein